MYAKQIKEKTFSWGARAFSATFPAHGAVSLAGSIIGGSRLSGSEAFASVHAEILPEGTGRHSKKELQILLDSIGASLSFSAGSERLSFTGRVRVENLDKLLSLVAEILHKPTFPAEELAILQKREISNLALEAQDTRIQAQIAFSRMLFSRGHPNFQNSTEESRKALAEVTPKKLSDYHKKTLDGSSLIISIAGDVAPAKTFFLVDRYFKKLPLQDVVLPKYQKGLPGKSQKKALHIKHKASIDYMIGIATGITKDSADYPALLLGIHVLGLPGFLGRLMSVVREKEGLTYATYAYLAGFQNTDGYIEVWSTFAPQLFEKGRAAILREIEKLVREGVSEQEVKKFRERFVAATRTRLSTSGAFAGAAHDIGVENRKLSYLDEFPVKVGKLTARQVNAALKKYLVPAKLSEAAAGPIEKLVLSS